MAQPLSLLTLPDELLLGVLSHLPGEPESLSAIACACRRLQDLAEPFIFASNLITNGSQVPRLSHALTARKERLRSVHSLDLRCRFEHTAGMTSMMTLLPALVNLKQLTIESPWCNRPRVSPPAWDDEVESYARIFRDASLLANSYDGGPTQPLARLQSCEDSFSILGDSKLIFDRYPTLERCTETPLAPGSSCGSVPSSYPSRTYNFMCRRGRNEHRHTI